MRLRFLVPGLAVALHCGSVLGLGIPVKDVRMRRAESDLKDLFHQHEKRITCIEDDALMSLQTYRDDSEEFCSSYLGINPVTATAYHTAKTTVTIIYTTFETVNDGTITVPSATVTKTVAAPGHKVKRQDMTTAAPVSALAQSCSLSPQNSTLISIVSSACSCLFLTTATDVVPVTITSTRTLEGTDYEATTVYATVTSGVVTVTPIPTSSIVLSTSSPSIPIAPSSSSSFSVPIPPFSIPSGSRGEAPSASSSSSSSSVGPSVIFITSDTIISSQGGSSTPTPINGTSHVASTTKSTIQPSHTSPYSTCPAINGATYECECQEFKILCGEVFDSGAEGGLQESDIFQCIQACAGANNGFSEETCYGVSFYPTRNGGSNCYFLNQNELEQSVKDNSTISAVIVNNDTCAHSTTPSSVIIPSTSLSSVSSLSSMPIPTFSFSLSIPSGPRQPGSTTQTSGSPSPSLNSTALPSSRVPSSKMSTGSVTLGPPVSTSISPSKSPVPSSNSTSLSTTPIPSYTFSLPPPPSSALNSSSSGHPTPPFSISTGGRVPQSSSSSVSISGSPSPSVNASTTPSHTPPPSYTFSLPPPPSSKAPTSGTPKPSSNSSSLPGTTPKSSSRAPSSSIVPSANSSSIVRTSASSTPSISANSSAPASSGTRPVSRSSSSVPGNTTITSSASSRLPTSAPANSSATLTASTGFSSSARANSTTTTASLIPSSSAANSSSIIPTPPPFPSQSTGNRLPPPLTSSGNSSATQSCPATVCSTTSTYYTTSIVYLTLPGYNDYGPY